MTVYVVLVEDRHTGNTVEVYADKDTALTDARVAAENLSRSGDYEEDETSHLFLARCSEEGDYVTVMKTEVRR